MAAATITAGVVTGGSNSHQTTAEDLNAYATDFVTQGVVGTITANSGSGGTGSFCVNADGTPDMGVTVLAGQAYVSGTPSTQNSQVLRARMTSNYTAYTINANSSGSTKYDWVYLKLDATKANTPALAADDVLTLYTSRSSSNSSDNGSPPTYGILLAVVTVANGASSITNSNITDRRTQALIGAAANSLNTYQSESTYDYVASGLVWTADSAGSTLNASLTSGVVYISGARNTVSAVSGRAFTASKDTYIDVLYSSTGAGTLVYTEVANNAASPALAASSVRIGIIVTGVANIASAASINQGQEDKLLPIASSIPYVVADSLGNLICPRDPNRKLLGYRQITANQTTITTVTDLTGLSVTVSVPSARKIKITGYARVGNTTVDSVNNVYIFEGANQLQAAGGLSRTNSGGVTLTPIYIGTVTAGSHTYKLRADTGGGSMSVFASSTANASITVELE